MLGTFSNFVGERASPINWRLKPFIYLYSGAHENSKRVNLRNVNLKTEKSHWRQIFEEKKARSYPLRTAAWQNQKESESGSLMLKSYSNSIIMH